MIQSITAVMHGPFLVFQLPGLDFAAASARVSFSNCSSLRRYSAVASGLWSLCFQYNWLAKWIAFASSSRATTLAPVSLSSATVRSVSITSAILQRDAATAATAFVRMEVAQGPYLGLPNESAFEKLLRVPSLNSCMRQHMSLPVGLMLTARAVSEPESG
jgi:hypothetical protein